MTRIRFTEPQLALIAQAQNCNFKNLIEISFDFAKNGKLLDCNGVVAGTTPDYGNDGTELALLLHYARRRLDTRPTTTATIIPFPGGSNA